MEEGVHRHHGCVEREVEVGRQRRHSPLSLSGSPKSMSLGRTPSSPKLGSLRSCAGSCPPFSEKERKSERVAGAAASEKDSELRSQRVSRDDGKKERKKADALQCVAFVDTLTSESRKSKK